MNKLQYLIVLLALGCIAYVTSSGWIEIIASVSGLFCVWLAARENIWYYPVGFLNILLFIYIFYEVKLYADVTLQFIFFILSVYGWIIWLTKRAGQPVRPTTQLTARGWLSLIILIPIISYIWGYVLHTYTDASLPYLDAFVASLSIAAQYLLSRKILQNWYVWILVDILSIAMYSYKGLYTISFTYFVFLLICISGLIVWKRNYSQQAKNVLKIEISVAK